MVDESVLTEARCVLIDLEHGLDRLRGIVGVDRPAALAEGDCDVSVAAIGANLLRLRDSVCSQAQLAQMMRRDGYRWSASTVWAIETGQRNLRLDEAVRVVRHLGYGVDAIFELIAPVKTGGAS